MMVMLGIETLVVYPVALHGDAICRRGGVVPLLVYRQRPMMPRNHVVVVGGILVDILEAQVAVP